MPRQPESPVTRPLAAPSGDAASDNTGDASGSIARELGALGLAAIAAFAGLSLVSYDLASHSNLAGPLGYRLAAALTESLGVQSYIVAALIVWMAAKVWSAEGLDALRRSALGGSILVTALSAAIALLIAGDPQASGAIGRDTAAWLERYLSFGGSLMVLALAIICGVVFLVERAPTDLTRGVLGRLRRPHADGDTDLEDFDSGVHVLDAADEYDEADGAPVTVTELRELREPLAPSTGRAPARPRSKRGFKLPSLSLLDSPSLTRTGFDEAALEKSARLLEQKLAAFSVDGRVVEVQPGPVVTMFKFEPGSGVKVSQIVNLADDLSLAMKAPAVRIQAPVPGEAVVGIEVPNRKREKIYLREILESEEFSAAQGHLVIALGKDISGRPVVADLARMPHLLIAGATGTGKSVAIHTMISSILFNSTDDDVRFILIDPKMLELSAYEQVPHLLVPVVVDPDKAAAALLWATQEMEYRYRLMRDKGVRNIEGYNQVVAKTTPIAKPPAAAEQSSPDARPLEHRRLPKIVIVIDELADLLLHEGKTVERDITRLAQKARASGIHLILATQRPSVDVITGLIKANLPARISLQVTSRVDSRTILDSIGAERLLGEGDMLFMPPGTAKLRRLHGPFVSEVEIRKVTDFLRAQGAPEYQMEILETKRPEAGDGDGLGGLAQDEMYDEAVRIVIESNQASISMIQRRLRIGYNRAARMVEQMEREGLVLPADGARPREVRGLRGAG